MMESLYNKENLPIDAIISPENEVAKAIYRRLHAPGAIDMFDFTLSQIIEYENIAKQRRKKWSL